MPALGIQRNNTVDPVDEQMWLDVREECVREHLKAENKTFAGAFTPAVAVNVIFSPKSEVFDDELTASVVPAWFTVTEAGEAVESLAEKLVSAP